jgi:hypothetical protein
MKPTIRAVAILTLAIALSVTTIATGNASSTTATPKAAAVFARLVNKGSEKCMNIPGGSTAEGAGVTQFTCGTWNDHYWSFDEINTNLYWIRNGNSNLCLSITSESRGEQLAQRTCIADHKRAWRFNIFPDGRFQMINSFTGMCIGVAGGSTLNNAAVIQWPCGAWADHAWGYVA